MWSEDVHVCFIISRLVLTLFQHFEIVSHFLGLDTMNNETVLISFWVTV